jgi:U3 small nucleolar RNA-associated protein 7
MEESGDIRLQPVVRQSGSGKKRRREPGTQESARLPGTAPAPEKVYGVAPLAPARKYSRGAGNTLDRVKDKKLRSRILRGEDLAKRSAKDVARSELLLENDAGFLEAEGMERTYKFRQADIAAAVDVGVARKSFELTLDTYGPYRMDHSRNGRYTLLAGAKGHLAVVDWEGPRVSTEFHVNETVRDACFLHTSMMFAAAQKQYAYIYDHTGMQIHALRNHIQPLALAFLPHHFLLASVGNAGYLKYQDVSTGALVAEHATRLGPCDVLRANPWNGVLCAGHTSGVVTMWTPNLSSPVVKMLVHRGPVSALAVDAGGRYMATSGMDSRLKVRT